MSVENRYFPHNALLTAGIVALSLGAPGALLAQSSGDVVSELASSEGIFVDGKTFKIARGKAQGDPAAVIAKLGAKEVGPGAIIFRSGDKLYMVEGAPQITPQAMKSFQDQWSNSMKNFQDNWKSNMNPADTAVYKATIELVPLPRTAG